MSDLRSLTRVIRHRRIATSWLSAACWLLLVAFLLVALVGPVLIGTDPMRQSNHPLLPMGSSGHLLGTDDLGRDELARLVHGSRPLLLVAVLATALATLIGLLIGLVAGYFGGLVNQVIMRIVDLMLAFPSILLIILLVAGAGAGTTTLVIGIGIALAPGLARLARALAAREAARDYVLASKLGGSRGPRIMLREILPNIAGPMMAQVVMTLSIAAGFAAGLSYLGLGQPVSTADWGNMVQAGQEFVLTTPSLTLLPAVATLIFVVACNFAGDDLRDALDPRGLT